ncbi:hypothetical protein GW17_00025800 [Ensete ventricosum]|nr:hypothetical protein GW17_00025800 [Ensete ventricosum]
MCTRAGGRAQANNETSAREDHRSNAGKWRDYPLEMEDSGEQQEQGHHGPTTAHVLRALLRHSRKREVDDGDSRRKGTRNGVSLESSFEDEEEKEQDAIVFYMEQGREMGGAADMECLEKSARLPDSIYYTEERERRTSLIPSRSDGV